MLNLMRRIIGQYYVFLIGIFTLVMLVNVGSGIVSASAFPPESGSDSVGLQGTISEAAPTQAATISTPINGTNLTTSPVTVAGLCPKNLLVKVFSNNVFVGSTLCTTGSYTIQVDLFEGENELVTRVYDALDQPGPDSNTVTINYTNIQIIQYGTVVSLTSNYAERGANPGTVLEWPIILSGGTGPYALSVNWGDGSPSDLLSVSFAGNVTISHDFKTAGVYNTIIQATDTKGTEAYLQVVAVADGAILSNNSGSKTNSAPVTDTKVLWWPAAAMVPLIAATFWVGRRHELYTLRKQLEKSRKGK
jgi:hypothetical protein